MASAMQPIGNDPLDPNRLSLNNGLHQGEFFLGPQIPAVNASPVQTIVEHLAKRDDGADEFVTMKMLLLSHKGGSSGDGQGKVLLHNEHLILSLLQDQPGVIHHHGLFKDRSHFILVLDCLVPHDYDREGRYKDFINLQHYVIREKRLKEREALELFCTALSTVKTLHKKNIVHRDLKLGNMVLNTRTRAVTLLNFALSKHLVRENDPLTDQRGSLAYVSPDVLSGNPYDGKASDMWAMGVLLYTMLYGQFPFYDNDPQELFRKIRTADYVFPNDDRVSMDTTILIRHLIEWDAKKRLTAGRTLETAQSILSRLSVISISELTYAQIVPDVDRHNSQDCTVPDQQEDGSPEAIIMETNLASNVEMNAVRLTLSPMLLADPHGSHMIHPVESHAGHTLSGHSGLGTGPMPVSPPVGICPTSQGAGHFMPYSLTEIPHVHLSYPISHLNRNPFIHPCSSAPAFFNASPTNSLGTPSPTTSFSSINMVPPSSPPQSYPHPSLVCHRYPLTLSLSDDSYFTSSHPTQPQVHSHPYSHTHIHSQPHTNGNREDNQNSDRVVVSNQSVLESLVTVRTSSSTRGSNRHSYSEGETPSLRLPSSYPRQRRNSSGSEQRRRHSHHTYGNGSSVLSADATSIRRHRRRSHDARDERADILESLRVVAARQTSQSQCIPIRVFGPSTPTAQTHQQS